MRVVHWGRAKRFYRSHPDAEAALRHWRTTLQRDSWTSFANVKFSFNSADFVNGKIVFNIKGNKYRLIASVRFDRGTVFIEDVLTHEEYNKNKWGK